MVKIKKILVYILTASILASIGFAAQVGYVVQFPDSSVATGCVDVATGTDGYYTMQATGLSLLWSDYGTYGHMLCRINGIGDDVAGTFCVYSGNFWGSNILMDGSWATLPVGSDGPGSCWNRDLLSWGGHYCAQEGDVLGWVYGDGSTSPPVYEFKALCPKLKITEIKAYVDGDKTSGVDETGGTIRNARPGSEIELRIEVSNLYHDSENIEIEDIEVTGTLEDVDNDDIEDEVGQFDLDADDEETARLTFKVPLDVDEDDYDLVIELEGEDNSGWHYEQELELKVEVEKERHELRIIDLEMSPDLVRCDRNTKLGLGLMNLGSRDEEVELVVESSELGITINSNAELDEGDSYYNEFYMKVGDDIEPGTYQVKVIADYGSEKEIETVDLRVESCSSSTGTQQSTLIIESQGTTTQHNPSTIIQGIEPAKEESSNKTIFFLLLGYSAVIIIGLTVFLALKP